MPPLTEFHASMADLADERHQNMDGLVLPEDFNPEVVVRFQRENGILTKPESAPATRNHTPR